MPCLHGTRADKRRIMFQFSFVLCTIKYKMRLGEKFFLNLNKETSCEIDKVRKLSKHKHVVKDLFAWIVFYVFSSNLLRLF